jgi:hypothetical protein
MFNKKEISWKHIKGVYEYTNQHATAKAIKLTKQHIWLTSWSRMHVDLAEHTLSKEVEDALASIKKLKEIQQKLLKILVNFFFPKIICNTRNLM